MGRRGFDWRAFARWLDQPIRWVPIQVLHAVLFSAVLVIGLMMLAGTLVLRAITGEPHDVLFTVSVALATAPFICVLVACVLFGLIWLMTSAKTRVTAGLWGGRLARLAGWAAAAIVLIVYLILLGD